MENKNNIALIGFMGVGKTLVSNMLGEILNREVVSTDEVIEKNQGMRIVDLFNEKGESVFRQLEKDLLKQVVARERIILDCGGGLILDPENWEILKSNFTVIYLMANADTIYNNIKGMKNRPLLDVESPKNEIMRLLKLRTPYYNRAEFRVDTNGKSIDQMAREVIKIINERA